MTLTVPYNWKVLFRENLLRIIARNSSSFRWTRFFSLDAYGSLLSVNQTSIIS